MGRDAAPLVPLTDDQRAMVEQNLGLVGHTLKVYFGQLCGDEDAWNDGVIGLARATRNYDPNRSSFSTYAINWIRSEIGNGIGRLAGLNARNAHRRGVDYEPPMSLDVVLSDDDGTSLGYLLADPDARFEDLGSDYYDRHVNTNTKKRSHIRGLEALGYRVTLEPAA